MTNKEIFPHPLSVHNYIVKIEGSAGLYMESGVLDLLQIAPNNADTYTPANIVYGSDIDAIRGTNAALGKLQVKEASPGVLKGDNMDAGESNAVGCAKKSNTLQLPDGDIITAGTPTYCIDNLYSKKNTQNSCPAGMFSGKLRWLVQGIYGSKRTDYSCPALGEALTVENGTFYWGWNGNNGLYSSSNYEYFVIRVTTAGVYAKQLQPTSAGKILQKYLQTHSGIDAEREKRYETYLLSTLQYGKGDTWVNIGGVGDAYSKGQPWSYGWHWNLAGTTAKVVTYQQKSGTTNVWQTTLFTLSVSENANAGSLDDGRLSASISTTEDTQDVAFRVGKDIIWTPDFETGLMQFFVTQADALDTPAYFDCDVPIYIASNYASDSFDLLRFKRTDLGTGSWGGGLITPPSPYSSTIGASCEQSLCQFYSSSGGSQELGFYIESGHDATGKNGSSVHLDSIDWQKGAYRSELPPTDPGGGADCEGGAPAGTTTSKQRTYYADAGFLTITGASLSLKSMLIVPVYDCDSMFLGKWLDASGSISTGQTTSQNWTFGGWNYYDSHGNLIASHNGRVVYWTDPVGVSGPFGAWGDAVRHGYYNSDSATTDWDDNNIYFIANGESHKIHRQQRIGSAINPAAMHTPPCANLGSEALEDPGWSNEALNLAGFTWAPAVIFPVGGGAPDEAAAVVAKVSANYESYSATNNPTAGSFGTYTDDGSYDFDNISRYWSYVGFA